MSKVDYNDCFSDDVGDAIKNGEADALYERIRENSSDYEEEYEPVTLSWSEARWVMDMVIEVQVERARNKPVMGDGERDKLLLLIGCSVAEGADGDDLFDYVRGLTDAIK